MLGGGVAGGWKLRSALDGDSVAIAADENAYRWARRDTADRNQLIVEGAGAAALTTARLVARVLCA